MVARRLEAAAGFAGCRADVAAARALRAGVLAAPLAVEAARDGCLALAVADRGLAFCAFALALLGTRAARRVDAAAGFLVSLAGVVVARVPRAATLPVALLAAGARAVALRRSAAGVTFLTPAADVGLRPAFAGRAPRAGVFTAALRAVVAFDAAGLPARDGAAVLALLREGAVAPRTLRAAVVAGAPFRLAVAGLARVVDADGR